jgi:hypothetical protein
MNTAVSDVQLTGTTQGDLEDIMRHTLKAVFNRRSDAQHVLDELLACGYSRTDTEISNAEGLAASVRHRLARLVASRLHKHSTEDAGASMSGRHVVTLTADSEPDAERAMHIIQRFHPVGIEDLPGEWDHDSAGRMPSACPPGTEPGALLYRSRENSPYFGTQNANSPPIGNTFEEPMGDGGRWGRADDSASRARKAAPPTDADKDSPDDRAP